MFSQPRLHHQHHSAFESAADGVAVARPDRTFSGQAWWEYYCTSSPDPDCTLMMVSRNSWCTWKASADQLNSKPSRHQRQHSSFV